MGERAFTVNLGNTSFDVWEQVGSPKLRWGDNAQELVATYKCRWQEWFDVYVALLGFTEDATTFLKRHLPHGYGGTGKRAIFAQSITGGRGDGPRGKDDDGEAKYQWAIFDVIYRPSAYPILPDELGTDESTFARYVSKRVERTFSEISYRGGAWEWRSGPNIGKKIPDRITLLLKRGTLVLTWHNVPRTAVPPAALQMVNYVNADALTHETDTFAVHTLRYEGPEYEPVTMANLDAAVNIRYRFAINPDSWLKLPDPGDDNNYHLVGKDVGGPPVPVRLFTSGEFTKLFTPGGTI